MRILYRSFFPLFLSLFCLAGLRAETAAPNRVDLVSTPYGADLITFYRNDVPQLVILRDTLGDPQTGAHRLRQVWDLTYSRPTWKQRAASAIPFFYHRAGANTGSLDRAPKPLLDLMNPRAGVVRRVGEEITQIDFLDTYGAFVRAPTRAYRGNADDYRNMSLARSVDIVRNGTAPDELPATLGDIDWDQVDGRLLLAGRLLGGYVSEEHSGAAALADQTFSRETRAANWDLLRQQAEADHLYVEPLEPAQLLGSEAPREAVLWFAAGSAPPPRFDPAFLLVSDPWRDSRLLDWKSYTCEWNLDPSGAVGAPGAPNAKPTRMIPLALFSLDYPRVPLLLIDFHSDRAKRREMTRRAAGDVATGVFGLTPYSSLAWFAARTSYIWYRDRHGAALNRTERMAAYAGLRQDLLDARGSLDPAFHRLIEFRLDAIALNPFEQSTEAEVALAARQYAALLAWAASPEGLAKSLGDQRAREYYRDTHTHGQRAWAETLHISTLGLWRPDRPHPDVDDSLDRERRAETALRLIRQADRQTDGDLFADADRVRAAALEVSASAPLDSERALLAARVINRLRSPASVPSTPGAGQ